jgi:Flp pilus assembly protein TadG
MSHTAEKIEQAAAAAAALVIALQNLNSAEDSQIGCLISQIVMPQIGAAVGIKTQLEQLQVGYSYKA